VPPVSAPVTWHGSVDVAPGHAVCAPHVSVTALPFRSWTLTSSPVVESTKYLVVNSLVMTQQVSVPLQLAWNVSEASPQPRDWYPEVGHVV